MSEKKVLVIDDEDFIRELVKDFLELDEVACVGAETRESALQLVQEYNFNLILLDRNLGNVKAEEFITEIRDIHPEIPIIILTGDPNCGENYLRETGADGIIYKPFQVNEFMDCINKFMEI